VDAFCFNTADTSISSDTRTSVLTLLAQLKLASDSQLELLSHYRSQSIAQNAFPEFMIRFDDRDVLATEAGRFALWSDLAASFTLLQEEEEEEDHNLNRKCDNNGDKCDALMTLLAVWSEAGNISVTEEHRRRYTAVESAQNAVQFILTGMNRNHNSGGTHATVSICDDDDDHPPSYVALPTPPTTTLVSNPHPPTLARCCFTLAYLLTQYQEWVRLVSMFKGIGWGVLSAKDEQHIIENVYASMQSQTQTSSTVVLTTALKIGLLSCHASVRDQTMDRFFQDPTTQEQGGGGVLTTAFVDDELLGLLLSRASLVRFVETPYFRHMIDYAIRKERQCQRRKCAPTIPSQIPFTHSVHYIMGALTASRHYTHAAALACQLFAVHGSLRSVDAGLLVLMRRFFEVEGHRHPNCFLVVAGGGSSALSASSEEESGGSDSWGWERDLV
jgi:hypothetical protein